MKRKILILIGTLTFVALMFFNVQFMFQVDDYSKIADIELAQDEAYAYLIPGWGMEKYEWGCRCEEQDLHCFISMQCLCEWGNCMCCD